MLTLCCLSELGSQLCQFLMFFSPRRIAVLLTSHIRLDVCIFLLVQVFQISVTPKYSNPTLSMENSTMFHGSIY